MPLVSEQRVRYAETDKMGVVYYANYLVWFEIGRVELLRSLGFDYSKLEIEHGCMLPVVDVNCRYRAPARYDDTIYIHCEPTLLRGFVLKFAYRIERANPGRDPLLLAEGGTTHVICTPEMQKCLLPEQYEAVIRAAIPSETAIEESEPSSI